MWVCVCVSVRCSVLGVADGCDEEAAHNEPVQSNAETVPKKNAAIQYAGVLQKKRF